MSHRTDQLESFKNSLRWSLRFVTCGQSEKKVRLGTWDISAPTHELPSGVAPQDISDLLIDCEFNPPEVTRLWFELTYSHFNRVFGMAVYRARCEEF